MIKVSKCRSFTKIIKCIESCTTKEQIESVRNMLYTHDLQFNDPESLYDLWVPYNLKFFEIKESKNNKDE